MAAQLSKWQENEISLSSEEPNRRTVDGRSLSNDRGIRRNPGIACVLSNEQEVIKRRCFFVSWSFRKFCRCWAFIQAGELSTFRLGLFCDGVDSDLDSNFTGSDV